VLVHPHSAVFVSIFYQWHRIWTTSRHVVRGQGQTLISDLREPWLSGFAGQVGDQGWAFCGL